MAGRAAPRECPRGPSQSTQELSARTRRSPETPGEPAKNVPGSGSSRRGWVGWDRPLGVWRTFPVSGRRPLPMCGAYSPAIRMSIRCRQYGAGPGRIGDGPNPAAHLLLRCVPLGGRSPVASEMGRVQPLAGPAQQVVKRPGVGRTRTPASRPASWWAYRRPDSRIHRRARCREVAPWLSPAGRTPLC